MLEVELGWDPADDLGCCLDVVPGQVREQIQVLE